MSDRVRVWCLRHVESEANAEVAGAGNDSSLTARGRGQAVDAAHALAAEPIARVYSSTALRARQIAELLATTLGVATPAISGMPELVEVGCTADVLRAWVVERDLMRHAADGETGETEETGRQVVDRVVAALQKIAGAHSGETVAVVGHVASLTVALGRLCCLGPEVWSTPLPYARPFLVEWDGHAWHCPTWPVVGAFG